MKHLRCLGILISWGWILLAGVPACGDMPGVRHGWLLDIRQAWLVHDSLVRGSPADNHPVYLATGLGTLYGMPDLPMNQVNVALGVLGLESDLHWNRTGSAIWMEETLEIIVGSKMSSGPALVFERRTSGPTGRGIGESQSARSRLDLRLRFSPGQGSTAWLRMKLFESAPTSDPRFRVPWFLIQSGKDRFRIVAQLWRRSDQSPSPAMEVHFRLAETFTIGISAEPTVSLVGMLFSFVQGNYLLRSSHTLHPALGMTHRWELVYRFEGP